MKKLKLQVEELRVEQFQLEPDAATISRGTVQGRQLSLASCISCPCGDTDNGGGDTVGCASFYNSQCYYCVDEPLGQG